MNQTKTTYEPFIVPQFQKAASALLEVARLWAGQGLSIGKQVLETSAKTLSLTAETIDGIKQRVEGNPKP